MLQNFYVSIAIFPYKEILVKTFNLKYRSVS